jgi:hypothetical protein
VRTAAINVAPQDIPSPFRFGATLAHCRPRNKSSASCPFCAARRAHYCCSATLSILQDAADPISAAKPPSCGLDVANPRVAAFSCTCIPRSLPGHDKSRWLPNHLSRLRVGNVAGDPLPPNSRPTSISICPRVQTHAVDSGLPAAPRAVPWAKPYLQFLAHLASKCRGRRRPALGDGRVPA